jgi:hypothetical protein
LRILYIENPMKKNPRISGKMYDQRGIYSYITNTHTKKTVYWQYTWYTNSILGIFEI